MEQIAAGRFCDAIRDLKPLPELLRVLAIFPATSSR
jgi:hypothetical protein